MNNKEVIIEVDPRTNEPHHLWEDILAKERIYQPIQNLLSLTEPIKPNYVRFVCISDTHEKLDELLPQIPAGDVLIHCGDFTNFGDESAIRKFDTEIGLLPHKYKIVIAGNHELGFEDNEDLTLRGEKYIEHGTPEGYKLLKNCIYLHDNSVTVFGIKVYGSSWHPLPGYSFSRERGEALLKEWKNIPSDTDILLTHTPPLGYLDLFKGERWGCTELLNTVEYRVKPKYHIFGHVHEQNGIATNGKTTFINASICNHDLEIVNKPIIFDIPLPKNVSKI
uniref:Calcineurin-like phosphoesterase domain-containing protein n=1 Tax=Panagrolaimus sp. PS1159 TaxID=55785 RepID=A0AC35G5Z2_9BILA